MGFFHKRIVFWHHCVRNLDNISLYFSIYKKRGIHRMSTFMNLVNCEQWLWTIYQSLIFLSLRQEMEARGPPFISGTPVNNMAWKWRPQEYSSVKWKDALTPCPSLSGTKSHFFLKLTNNRFKMQANKKNEINTSLIRWHMQPSEGHVNDSVCKELEHLVTRH